MCHIKSFEQFNENLSNFTRVTIGNNNLKCEICKSHKDGLIGRKILGDGMIFIFEKSNELSFHTNGCIIPIDIIFINNSRVVEIHKNCQPNSNLSYDCSNANVVIELPGNSCDSLRIAIGDLVSID